VLVTIFKSAGEYVGRGLQGQAYKGPSSRWWRARVRHARMGTTKVGSRRNPKARRTPRHGCGREGALSESPSTKRRSRPPAIRTARKEG